MSQTVFPPAKLACQAHFMADCPECFRSDPSFDRVDQQLADKDKRIAELEAARDDERDRKNCAQQDADDAEARAEKAEARLALITNPPGVVTTLRDQDNTIAELGKRLDAMQDRAAKAEALSARAAKAEAAVRIIDGFLAKFEADYVVDGEGLIERARLTAREVLE